MQPIAGFNYGAGKMDRLLRVLRLAVVSATCITTIGFLIAMFFARPCVALFAKDAPELIDEAARGLRIIVLFFPIVGMQIVSTAFFQSIGMPGKSIFLSLTRQLIFLLPALLILPHVFADKVTGVWCAMPFADVLACCVSGTMLVYNVRKFKRQSSLQAS